MNREIKFRAWEKNLKQMIPVNNADFERKIINFDSAWRMFDEIELMQYVGLKDKNGKEIYEGDIVKYFDNKEHIVVVENIKELGTGMYLKRVGSGYYTLNPSVIRDYEVEVIGNIHDNPELLEVV